MHSIPFKPRLPSRTTKAPIPSQTTLKHSMLLPATAHNSPGWFNPFQGQTTPVRKTLFNLTNTDELAQ